MSRRRQWVASILAAAGLAACDRQPVCSTVCVETCEREKACHDDPEFRAFYAQSKNINPSASPIGADVDCKSRCAAECSGKEDAILRAPQVCKNHLEDLTCGQLAYFHVMGPIKEEAYQTVIGKACGAK